MATVNSEINSVELWGKKPTNQPPENIVMLGLAA